MKPDPRDKLSSREGRRFTPDQLLQGAERDLDTLIREIRPSASETATRDVKHLFGVFFPWMRPAPEE